MIKKTKGNKSVKTEDNKVMPLETIMSTLEMENELMLFNPSTGDVKSVDSLNDIDRSCYEAHEQAIKILSDLNKLFVTDK